ncbi:MAG: cold shock domain-containing protein [Nitrospiraceae bacterium]|nr:MAG: cold shock domain-containing protein [Nitrospiraceae bacterium]
MPKREIGIVRWFDSDEGCGFIARRHGEDIYVHYSAILCDGSDCIPKEGDPVEFTVVEGNNGLQAQKVVIKK